ncbi:MAG TPA: cobalamin-dependent protein [Burkholderiaceae bacterium]
MSLPIHSSISDVERDTGLAKETLRVWERRYGFPLPERDQFGDRMYPPEQVARLHMVKRLIDLGYRPGKLIQMEDDALRQLASQGAQQLQANADGPSKQALEVVSVCKAHDVAKLRQILHQELNARGVERFIVDFVGPVTSTLGACWASGTLAVFEEHLFTEALQSVLRTVIHSMPAPRTTPAPSVVLTTFPQERHGLGLLMAEAMFTAHGARCLSLGTQTPVAEIAAAAVAFPADVVALSFSSSMHPRHIADGIHDLRKRLPPAVMIWAGGAHARFARRADNSVRLLELDAVGASLAAWRKGILVAA